MGMSTKASGYISEFMRCYNFTRRGGFFFHISNSMSFCLSISQPTGILYCNFCIIPLYMPATERYFTYGNRINSFIPSPVPLIKKGESDAAILDWSTQLCRALENAVFPFFRSISDAARLNSFLQTDPYKIRRYFFCPEIDIYRLQLYTKLMLGDVDVVMEMLSDSHIILQRATHVQGEQQQKYIEDFSTVRRIATSPENTRHCFVEDTIKTTKQNLFR